MFLKSNLLENVWLHLVQEKIPQKSQEEDLMVKNICCICNMRNLTHHIVIHYDEYVGEHIKSDHWRRWRAKRCKSSEEYGYKILKISAIFLTTNFLSEENKRMKQEKISQNSQEEDLMVKNICYIPNLRNLRYYIKIHLDEYIGEHIKDDH